MSLDYINNMTNERVEELRQAYNQWVTHPDGHWKGRAIAFVPNDKAIIDLVREAMDFMGSIVCEEKRSCFPGQYVLFSEGYWANGF